MACLYRPRVTTWKLNGRCRTPDGQRVTKATPGAVKFDEGLSATWYGKFTLPSGEVRRVKLATDKTASKQILAKLVVDAKLAEYDLGGRFAEHGKRPLIEHLADYRAYLTDKGNTPKHVGQVVSAITACLTGCRFVRVADVQPSAVVGFIADLRAAGRGITTANLALTYLKSFTRWLLRDRRTVADPLASLSRLANSATDVRHARRDFSADELRQLLETTRTSGRTFRALTGLDRVAIYATAVGTGFRVAELASLTPDDFDLDANPPTIRVDASYAKNRKEASQPIPPELADGLADFLRGKPSGEPVWPGTWCERSADMIRLDLADARAVWLSAAQDGPERERRTESEFLIYCDSQGRYGDFHALRHTYVSLIVRSGATPKTAQTLARHADVRLTLGRYAHAGLFDLTTAVNALPSLTGTSERTEALAATGTDSARPDPRLDQTSEIS